jgi:hypothetical protein
MNLSDAAAVYAGTTEAKAVYYGATQVWPFSGWRQLGFTLLGNAAGDEFGRSVTINASGNRIAVGAPLNDAGGNNAGAIRVLDWNGTNWSQIGNEILGVAAPNPGSGIGRSLAMSADGNILAISSNSGRSQVYQWNGIAWAQMGSNISGAGSAISLSADGAILVIGTPDGSNFTGYVQVYDWNGTSWIQRGANITEAQSRLGFSVDLSDDGGRLVIGARDTSGDNTGNTRVLEWNGSDWVRLGDIIQGQRTANQEGWSVAINSTGNRIATGARLHAVPTRGAGNTRIFEWNGTAWVQMGSDINGDALDDWSGVSVALNSAGDILAIGSQQADSGGTDSGHVRVYKWNGIEWMRLKTIDGAAAGDNFFPVALDSAGSRLIAGGPLNDEAATNAGHARVFEFV